MWTDGTQNTCTAVGTDPEVWKADGNTPLAGTLVGTKRYWSGLQAPNYTIWPSNQPGFAPIANDPTDLVPAGRLQPLAVLHHELLREPVSAVHRDPPDRRRRDLRRLRSEHDERRALAAHDRRVDRLAGHAAPLPRRDQADRLRHHPAGAAGADADRGDRPRGRRGRHPGRQRGLLRLGRGGPPARDLGDPRRRDQDRGLQQPRRRLRRRDRRGLPRQERRLRQRQAGRVPADRPARVPRRRHGPFVQRARRPDRQRRGLQQPRRRLRRQDRRGRHRLHVRAAGRAVQQRRRRLRRQHRRGSPAAVRHGDLPGPRDVRGGRVPGLHRADAGHRGLQRPRRQLRRAPRRLHRAVLEHAARGLPVGRRAQ